MNDDDRNPFYFYVTILPLMLVLFLCLSSIPVESRCVDSGDNVEETEQ
jgi:hypothetical protein